MPETSPMGDFLLCQPSCLIPTYFNRIIHHTTSKTGTVPNELRTCRDWEVPVPDRAAISCIQTVAGSWYNLPSTRTRAGWASHGRYPYPQALTGMHPPSDPSGAFQGNVHYRDKGNWTKSVKWIKMRHIKQINTCVITKSQGMRKTNWVTILLWIQHHLRNPSKNGGTPNHPKLDPLKAMLLRIPQLKKTLISLCISMRMRRSTSLLKCPTSSRTQMPTAAPRLQRCTTWIDHDSKIW